MVFLLLGGVDGVRRLGHHLGMHRKELGALIEQRLIDAKEEARAQYESSVSGIGYFAVDDLLPPEIASRIGEAFPDTGGMRLRQTLRERKFVSAQMDQHDPILEEAIYAFQEPGVVALVKDICALQSAFPDEQLYAGGISAMAQGHFLNPHLDNSHDKDRERWRVLNLLYYVSPDWNTTSGGNLELWPNGVRAEPVTLVSRFNRLVVMATHDQSWHSVNAVRAPAMRKCVSNYYFSDEPLKTGDRFHVTSFRGRPEQPARDVILRADAAARGLVRKVAKGGIVKSHHFYEKVQEEQG